MSDITRFRANWLRAATGSPQYALTRSQARSVRTCNSRLVMSPLRWGPALPPGRLHHGGGRPSPGRPPPPRHELARPIGRGVGNVIDTDGQRGGT